MQLHKIGWQAPVVTVYQCLGTHSMMASCQLCLTWHVLKAPKRLHMFEDACNKDKLAEWKHHSPRKRPGPLQRKPGRPKVLPDHIRVP